MQRSRFVACQQENDVCSGFLSSASFVYCLLVKRIRLISLLSANGESSNLTAAARWVVAIVGRLYLQLMPKRLNLICWATILSSLLYCLRKVHVREDTRL